MTKSFRRTYRRLFKKNRKNVTRYSIVGSNVALLLLVGFFVVNNSDSATTPRQNSLSATAEAAPANALDQLSSADIAVHAARMASLPEAVAVTNQADSEATQLAITATENKVVAKPQVVATGLKSSKDIKTYTTVEGDTISSLASKFGVTSDSIRWSNGLTREKIEVGKQLVVPPVSGIVYTIKQGDTADTLAQRYNVSKETILSDNDAEIAGLVVGQRALIRGGVQPAARSTVASFASYSTSGFTARYGNNGYDYGYCTWHAANRRAQIGRPIPANLGNAISWYSRARAAGLEAGTEPREGAVVYHRNIRGLGHVAYVESINSDGSLSVSDMNYPSWGRVTYRTVSPGEFGNYYFIY